MAIALATACDAPEPAKVGDALLAQATGVSAAPEGATVEVRAGTPVTLPDAPVIRLAVDREAPFGKVEMLLERIREKGATPVILVGQRRRIYAFELSQKVDEARAIQATVTSDNKFCVSPPQVKEAKCTGQLDGKHVDRAGTRELIREAVKAYGMTDIQLLLPRSLPWADAVRAIDGARTCCKNIEPTVELLAPRGDS